MALTGIGDVKSNALFAGVLGGKAGLRVAGRGDGDAANFSSAALDKLKGSAEGFSLAGSVAKFKVGNDTGSYNNATGMLNFAGNNLNLNFKKDDGSAAFGAKDDVAVGRVGNDVVVKNLSKGESYIFEGKNVKKIDNPAAAGTAAPTNVPKKIFAPVTNSTLTDAVVLARSGTAITAHGSASNVIINKAAGTAITGSANKDTVFNFSAQVGSITGGGGNDNVFSVGINSGATIDLKGKSATATAEASYVKLLGNAKKLTVNLDGGASMLDATGKTLTDTKVNSVAGSGGDTTTVAVKAGTLNGAESKLDLKNDNVAVDLGKLNKGTIDLGAGNNSLTINSVVGTSDTKAKITSIGNDTLKINTVNYATIDQTGNKSSWMKLAKSLANSDMTLGTGANSIDGAKATFNKANITQAAGGKDSTFISGKSFAGGKDSKNTISLNGDANSVSFSGTVSNANINLGGTGASTLMAGSLNNVNATSAGTSSTVTVKGGATNLNYTGSSGDDTLSFGGGVSNASFNLGAGNNSVSASKANANGKAADQNLTNVSMAATGTGSLTVIAKSLTTRKVAGVQGSNSITGGSGTTTINLSGSIGKNTTINLGTGANTLSASSIAGGKGAEGVNITMASAGNTANTQTLSVKGGVSRATINMGGADVKISMGGSLSNSNVTMGTGANSLVLSKVNSRGKTSYGNITNTTIAANGSTSNTLIAGGVTGGSKGSTSITLGDGKTDVSFARSIGANTTIDLGSGANTLIAKSIAGSKKGNVNIDSSEGTGSNSSTTLTIGGGAKFLNYRGSVGKDTLSFSGAISNADLDMGNDGGDSLSAVRTTRNGTRILQSLTNVSIGGSGVTMELGALKGKSTLELTGNNNVSLGSVAAGTTIDMGTGANTLNITKGITGGTGTKAVTIQFGTNSSSTSTQSVTINGNVSGLNYKGSMNDDKLKIIGKLSNSTIDLGSGADTLTVENKNSVAQTVTNSTISAAGTNASVTAGNLVSSGRNGSSTLTMSGGTLRLGNVSGRVNINMGDGISDVKVGTFNGENVKFTSSGSGSFAATSIGSKATVDFSASADGTIAVTTSGAIGNATLKFGTNSVTIIAGTTAGGTATAGNSNINGATIQATSATSVKVMATDMTGANKMDLGSATSGKGVTVAATGKISGTTSIKANGESINISAGSILGSASGGVNIDLSGATGTAQFTVTGDAGNFTLAGGNSTAALTIDLNTINADAKLGTKRSANIAATNAASIDMSVTGDYKNLSYTGTKNNDTLKLMAKGSNSTIDLGGDGDDLITGSNASTAAGEMTNTSITSKGNGTNGSTTLNLSSFLSSGGGKAEINLTTGTNMVTVANTLSGDVTLDGVTKNELTAGIIKGAGASDANRTKINIGTSGSGANSLNVTGGITNANISADGSAVTAALSGGLTSATLNFKSAKNTVTLGSGGAAMKLSDVDLNMGTSGGGSANTLNIDSGVTVDTTKDKGFNLNTYGKAAGGTIISGGGATLANTNITVHEGGANITLGGLVSGSKLSTLDTTVANNTVNIKNVEADVTMAAGKLLVDTFGSGSLKITSGGGGMSVKEMKGGLAELANGGTFHLGTMTGGTASLNGAVTALVDELHGGKMTFNNASSTLDLKSISGGAALDIKSAAVLNKFGGGSGASIGGTFNVSIDGVRETNGLTAATTTASTADKTKYGTGDTTL